MGSYNNEFNRAKTDYSVLSENLSKKHSEEQLFYVRSSKQMHWLVKTFGKLGQWLDEKY